MIELPRLKISYSIANAWLNGDKEGAMRMLLGERIEPTPAMQFGTAMHKEWEDEVKRTQCMPAVFGGQKILKPKTEQYYKTWLTDQLCVSGVVDLQYETEDGRTILVDYKTGKGNAGAYAGSLQAYVYQLFVPSARTFLFKHYNQYEGTTSTAIVQLTPETATEAIVTLRQVGDEIFEELDNRGYASFDNTDSHNHTQGEN